MPLDRRKLIQLAALAGAGLAAGCTSQPTPEQRVEQLLPTIEEAIRKYAHWDPHSYSFRYEFVERGEEFYRRAFEDPLERKGVDVTFSVPGSGARCERERMVALFSALVGGAYDDTTGTAVLPVPEHKPKGVICDLRAILGREVGLVADANPEHTLAMVVGEEHFHHSQLQNFPQLGRTLDCLTRKTIGRHLYVAQRGRESSAAARNLHALMSLVEGDATLFDQYLRREYFPHAAQPSLFTQLAAAVVIMMSPAWRAKAEEYVHGPNVLLTSPCVDVTRRETVDRLYRHPDEAIRIFRN